MPRIWEIWTCTACGHSKTGMVAVTKQGHGVEPIKPRERRARCSSPPFPSTSSSKPVEAERH